MHACADPARNLRGTDMYSDDYMRVLSGGNGLLSSSVRAHSAQPSEGTKKKRGGRWWVYGLKRRMEPRTRHFGVGGARKGQRPGCCT